VHREEARRGCSREAQPQGEVSDLDDFMSAAFTEAATIIGKVSFTIAGVFGTFTGILDRHASSQSLSEEGGGLVLRASATIVASKPQFQARPTKNAQLTVQGQTYEIDDVEDDSTAYTLKLRNPVD
jgi:hypothetical protein